MKEIKRYGGADAKLAEIYHTGFQLSLVSPKDEQCHSWVLCKDFFNDAIWAQIHKKDVALYSFIYKPGKNPLLSLDPLKVIVRDKTKANDVFNKKVQNSLKFLHIIEKMHKLKPSTVEQVKFDGEHSVWMFSCDKSWAHAAPMISLLGLCLRIGMYHDPVKKTFASAMTAIKACSDGTSQHRNDVNYLQRSTKMRGLIAHKGLKTFKAKMEDNYPEGTPINTIHHQWGIVNSPGQNQLKELWDLADIDVFGESGKITKKKVKKKATKKKAKKKVAKKKAKKKVAKKKAAKKKVKKVPIYKTTWIEPTYNTTT